MKNLLTLTSIKKTRVPKSAQASSYDYMKKLINTMGFTLEPLFLLFVEKVFDVAGDFLEKEVLRGMAASLARKGTLLPSTNTPTAEMTPALTKRYEDQNLVYMRTQMGLPANFLSVVKQQIAKDLVLMLF